MQNPNIFFITSQWICLPITQVQQKYFIFRNLGSVTKALQIPQQKNRLIIGQLNNLNMIRDILESFGITGSFLNSISYKAQVIHHEKSTTRLVNRVQMKLPPKEWETVKLVLVKSNLNLPTGFSKALYLTHVICFIQTKAEL